MLVIHPRDRTTAMLSTMYDAAEAKVISTEIPTKEIGRLLRHTSPDERIMLLGHGSDNGLFFRRDDTRDAFDRIIVGHPHAYHLRRHGANIVAVWCNADMFARAEGLHGLFSGMIVSEMSEAARYGIDTTQDELDRENIKLALRMRRLLDEGTLLGDIPGRMQALDDVHSNLTTFNYQNFFYL